MNINNEFQSCTAETNSMSVYNELGKEIREKLIKDAKQDAIQQAVDSGYSEFETVCCNLNVVTLTVNVEVSVVYIVKGK